MKKTPLATRIIHPETSALFSSIIESPKDFVIFALDRDYCYTVFNSNHRKTMLKIWGVEIEVGMNMLDIIRDPVDREKARRNFDRALKGESFTFLEEYGEPPNRYYYEDSYNPVLDESGNVIGVSLFLTDVTEKIKDNEELERYRARLEDMVKKRTAELEIANRRLEQELNRRRQTELTLNERETFLNSVLTSIQDGISVLDMDMNIQYNNPVMASWYADKMPLVGKKCYICYRDLDECCDPCPALRCIRSGKTETDIIRASQGAPVEWLEVSCFPMKDSETGELTGVVEFMRDITDRKRTEDQLKNSETFNRTVLSSIQEGFVVFDRNLNYLVWNPYMEKISGLKSAEVIGKNVLDLLPFVKEKNLDALLKKALSGETYKSPDFQYRIPDTGHEGWAQSIYSPHRDLDGNIIGVVVVVRDITRRKMVEQEITTWADALKSIRECVSVTDTENKLIFINRAFTQTYGYAAEEVIGRNIFEVAGSSKNPAETVAEILPATLRGGWQGELINRRKDGSEFSISLSTSPVYNDQNEVVALIGVAEDITKSKAIRSALKESEERYRTLFDYSNYGIFLHDLKGRIKDVNRQAVRLFGYTRDEILEMAVTQLHPTDEISKSKTLFKAIQTSGAEQFEINFKKKNGEIFPAEVSATIIKVGREKLVLGIVNDITSRKTARMKLMEREKLLRTIAENYPNSYLSIIEKDLTISYSAGQEFKKQNLDPEQFKGRTIDEVFGDYGAETLSKVKSAYQKTFRGREQAFEVFLNDQYQQYKTVPLYDDNGEIKRILAVVENITESKKAALALNESETKYRDLVENSVLGMALYFKDGGYQFGNRRFSEITGYSREEIESPDFDFAPLFSKDAVELINANIIKRLAGHQIKPYILPLTTKDKTQKYVEINNALVTFRGKPAIQIQLLDVTEKKQAEAALLVNLERTQKLQEIVGKLNRANTLEEILDISIKGILSAIKAHRASVLLADPDGVVRFKAWRGLSKAYRKVTEGHFPWKLEDRKASPICLPDIAKADLTPELRSCILKEGIRACSFIPLAGKNRLLGKFMVYYDEVHTFEADELNIARVLADNLAAVLERLQSNTALAASEERYRSTIESMKDLIFVISKDGYFIDYYAPDSSERLLTIPKAFLNQKFKDVLPEHVSELLSDAMHKLEAGDRSAIITYPMNIKGVELWFEAKLTARRNARDKYVGVTGVVSDITARKRGEKQLELIMQGTATETGEDFFINLVRCIAQAMETDVAFITRRLSDRPAAVRSIAMWQKERLSENISWETENTPCNRVLAGETVVIRDAVQKEFPEHHWLQQINAKSYMAVPLLDKEGSVIGHLGVLNSKPIDTPKQLARIISIFAIRAGSELQRLQAEEELNSIFNSNPLPVYVVDADHIILNANKAAQDYMELTLSELTGSRHGEVLSCIHHLDDPRGCGFGPDCKNCITRNTILDTFRDGKTRQGVNTEIILKSGKMTQVRNIRLNTSYFESLSGPRVMIVFEDITRQIQAQRIIKRSEENLSNLFLFTTDAIVLQNRNREIIDCNRATEKLFGYTRHELLNDRSIKLGDRERTQEKLRTKYLDRAMQGESQRFEWWGRKKDGTVFPEEIILNRTIYNGEEVLMVIIRDISNRKKMENDLRESEEKYRGIFDESIVPIILMDNRKCFIDTNQAGVDLLGYTKDELLKMSVADVDADPAAVIPAHSTLLAGDRIVNYEHKLKRKDGRIITVLNNSIPICDTDGKVVGMQSTLIDITENKKAEEDIQLALREKSILLNELYHRTKNNMQVISSLLALQSQKIADPLLLKNNEDMIHRIEAMALVHQKLYQSKDLSSINLNDYVEELAANLMEGYSDTGHTHELKLQVEPLQVLIDIAIPCGLLLNEMLTNALEHAFPDQRKGIIRIVLKKTKADKILLKISDNGVGLPAGLDTRRSESMGMRLIYGIAEQQLNGSVNVESNRGTTWTVEFEHSQYKRRV